jgi:putative sterol carrier protein
MHAVNTDDTYRSTAKGWTNPVALVVTPDTALPHGAAVQVNLVAGVCLSAESVLPAAVTAPFVLSADLATWKEIVAGAIDPIMAVARGKVKLAQGSLGTLMLHAKSAQALVACAQQIDTSWP